MAIRARVITPIVFCASLAPWASASNPPETIWRVAEATRHRAGPAPPDGAVDRRTIESPASPKASSGATSAGNRTLSTRPSASTALKPAAATVGPDHAADQRVRGARRKAEVPGDQIPGDRPDQPGEDDARRDRCGVDDVVGDGRGDRDRDEGAGEVEQRGDRRSPPEAARRRSRSTVATTLAVSWNPLVKSKAERRHDDDRRGSQSELTSS